jgi:hypothetical protein
MANAKSKKKETPVSKKSGTKGLTATEIVRKKLREKNSTITEEDMKHVRIDTSLPSDKAHEPLPIENDPERPKDEDKDNKMTTPWDVIN